MKRKTAKFITVAEMAEQSETSRSHIGDCLNRGDIPFIWMGRTRRVQREVWDNLLVKGWGNATSPAA